MKLNYRQLVFPNLETKDLPGWCLRFAGNAFATRTRPFPDAWSAWLGATKRHNDALPNVAVPVFFTWQGTIDGITKNWGDVAIWVPGKGVFGTPLRGSGNSSRWDPDVATRARVIGGGAKYVGWTEDLNGIKIIEEMIVNNPASNAGGAIEMIANTDQAIKAYKMLRPNGGGSENEIAGTAGKRTFAEFLNSAQAEIEIRDRADREKDTYIMALQNDLRVMKAQADELATRPTKATFDELHKNLEVCTAGATAHLELIAKNERELEQIRAKQPMDLGDQFEALWKSMIKKVKGIIK